MIRLNAQRWTVPAIAEIFECHEQTVRATLRRWEDHGLGRLWEALGRGAKRQWQEADLHSVEQWVEQDTDRHGVALFIWMDAALCRTSVWGMIWLIRQVK